MIVKERLLIFLKYLNIGQTAFERQVGLSNGYISKVKKSIGTQQLEKIFSKFTDLNSRWLLTGEGEMLKTTEEHTSDININEMGNSMLIEVINNQNKLIERLEKENAELRSQLEIREKATA